MAVMNSLAKADAFDNKAVEYDCGGEKVKLSPTIIKNYLVSGGGNVTDQEIVMFLNLCRYQKLNPFLREAYLIKFGDQPASIVVGKEVFTKRAEKIETCQGWKAGVVVVNKGGELIEREGTLILEDETLVGGWAMVFKSNWKEPLKHTVSFDEYVGRKKDGSVNAQWTRMPATMIRKVALMQALRDAFPDRYQGMYAPEEMGVDTPRETAPIDIAEPVKEPPKHKEPEIIEPEIVEESIDSIF